MEIQAKDTLRKNGEQSDDSDDQVSTRRITKVVKRKQPTTMSRSRSEKRVCFKRIRRLRKMIPNPKSESMELNGLFRETADYIVWLQMKVRMMQALVHVLNGSDE